MSEKKHELQPWLDRRNYLPTSRDEMDALGWEQADVILFPVMHMWIIPRLERP